MRALDVAKALFVILIWGSNFVVVKWGLEELSPYLLLALRFALIACFLIPFVKWPKGRFWPIFRYSMMLGVIHFGLMFSGMLHIDASTSALLSQLNTPFAVILSAFMFKDYPGWRRILGISIAFAGCVVVGGQPRFDGNFIWVLSIVLAALCWAYAATQAKRLGDLDPFTLNGWMAVMAAPCWFAISFLVEDNQVAMIMNAGLKGWGAAAFQAAFVTVTGYGIWYGLIKQYPLSRVIPFTLLLPVVGVAGGVLILGDALTVPMIIGGAMVVVGVGIVTIRQAAKGSAPDAEVR